jgi:hypothetical protein
MVRPYSSFFVLPALLLLAGIAAAQNTTTATCNFDDQRQLVVEYQQVTVNLKKPVSTQVPFGKP